MITKEITKDENASLISALISAFIPLLMRETLNKASNLSLVLPLMFYALYCFMKINDGNKYVFQFILISIILPFVDPTSMILLFSLIIYAIILYSESIELGNLRKESIFLASFVIIIGNFIVLKNIFYKYGLEVFKLSIPNSVYVTLYRDVSLLALVYFLGIITMLFGFIGVYYSLFKIRRRSIFLISSLMLTVLLILITKFIDFSTGLVFLGIPLSILSGLFISHFFNYLKITKFNHFKDIIYSLIILLIILLSIVPSYQMAEQNIKDSVSNGEIEAFKFLNHNIPEDAIVLTNFKEGNIMSAIAKRRNFMDTYLLLSDDVNERLRVTNLIYTTPFLGILVDQSKKNNINYIYLSKKTELEYNLNGLTSYVETPCFGKLFENDEAKIYQIKC